MSYLFSSTTPVVQENPSSYSPFSRKNVVYEVCLKLSPASSWLKELPNAHRLVQTLLQGEILGDYKILDFLIWPEGLFVRVSLEKMASLAEFLRFVKEKSATQGTYGSHWAEEPQWIRLVTPEKIMDSNRFFLETAEAVRRREDGFFRSLFFFYRNPHLSR